MRESERDTSQLRVLRGVFPTMRSLFPPPPSIILVHSSFLLHWPSLFSSYFSRERESRRHVSHRVAAHKVLKRTGGGHCEADPFDGYGYSDAYEDDDVVLSVILNGNNSSTGGHHLQLSGDFTIRRTVNTNLCSTFVWYLVSVLRNLIRFSNVFFE